MSLETIYLLKAFQLHYCPDNDAKSMVKHLIFLRKFAVIRKKEEKTSTLRRQIFEGKLSVSPHFLHHYQDNNEAGMVLVSKLSLNTLGVYIFIIF